MGFIGKGLNRVTDSIPEHKAFRRLQKHILKYGKMQMTKENVIPHEFMYKMLLSGVLEEYYEIDLKDSWMYAAAEKNLPIVPGWEDSTNIFYVCNKGELKASTMKSGIEYMTFYCLGLVSENSSKVVSSKLVVSQERFPICVSMLYQDMEMHDIPFGVISAKFQIQQQVMVLILEQYLMKKLLGVN
jgi:deoxyhypusine synthase